MTRERILNAAVELLSRRDATDVAMQDIAARAGVSVRTVYRNFATRDDLFDGVVGAIKQRVTELAGSPPTTPDEFAASAGGVVGAVYEIEPLYRALFATQTGRESHQRSAPNRRAEIEAAFAAVLADVGEHEATLLGAVVHLVTSSNAVLFLKDYWGLDADDAGRALQWVIGVVTDALKEPHARHSL